MSIGKYNNHDGGQVESSPRNRREIEEQRLIDQARNAVHGNIDAEIALGALIAHYHARLESEHWAQLAVAENS